MSLIERIDELAEQSEPGTEGSLVPVDEKITGGVALRGCINSATILEVTTRLGHAYDELVQEDKDDAIACIAYGTELDKDDETVLDHLLDLLAGARWRNSSTEGAQQRVTEADTDLSRTLWEGRSDNRELRLRKYCGSIGLHNRVTYETLSRPGVVYSLVGCELR